MHNQMTLVVRRCLQRYYACWMVCDDRVCGRRTMRQSVRGAACTAEHCHGRMIQVHSSLLLFLRSSHTHPSCRNTMNACCTTNWSTSNPWWIFPVVWRNSKRKSTYLVRIQCVERSDHVGVAGSVMCPRTRKQRTPSSLIMWRTSSKEAPSIGFVPRSGPLCSQPRKTLLRPTSNVTNDYILNNCTCTHKTYTRYVQTGSLGSFTAFSSD